MALVLVGRRTLLAVTPGQAAVFYDGNVVVGGGWICRQQALVPLTA